MKLVITNAEDLTKKEIAAIVSDVEAAVRDGKIRRVGNEEVTRLAALENSIALFNRDLDALYAAKAPERPLH